VKEHKSYYTYTCDVCGKAIPNDVLIVTLPTVWNMGEDGDQSGSYEWHIHNDHSYNGCAFKFEKHISDKFKATECGK